MSNYNNCERRNVFCYCYGDDDHATIGIKGIRL